MAFDNIGVPLGLTEKFSAEPAISDIHYNELENQRAKQQKIAQAKLFEDDTDYTNSINSYDNPRIKQAANAKIQELGKYVTQNPDWEQDPLKRQEVKRIKTDLRSIPIVGLQSDLGYKEMLKDRATAAKNPETYNKDAWDATQAQWDNYLKTGHQLGQEGFDKEGHKAFVYTQPNDKINYLKRTQELQKGIPMVDREDGSGNIISEGNPQTIKNVTAGLYNEDRHQADKEAIRAGYSNGLDYLSSLINPGKKINPNRSSGAGALTEERLKPVAIVTQKDDQTEVNTILPSPRIIEVNGVPVTINSVTTIHKPDGSIVGVGTSSKIQEQNQANKLKAEAEKNVLDTQKREAEKKQQAAIDSLDKRFKGKRTSQYLNEKNSIWEQYTEIYNQINNQKDNVDSQYPLQNPSIPLEQQQAIELQGSHLKINPAEVAADKAGNKVTVIKNDQRSKGAKISAPTQANTQSDFDSKWSALKPGETIVAPNGKTYTKK